MYGQPGLFARLVRLDRGTRRGIDCRQACECSLMLTGKLISVVVACYRDGGNVREMYSRLTSVLPSSPNQSGNCVVKYATRR